MLGLADAHTTGLGHRFAKYFSNPTKEEERDLLEHERTQNGPGHENMHREIQVQVDEE